MYIRSGTRRFRGAETSMSGLVPNLTEDQVQVGDLCHHGRRRIVHRQRIGDGGSVDLLGLFAIHGQALYDTALRMLEENENR